MYSGPSHAANHMIRNHSPSSLPLSLSLSSHNIIHCKSMHTSVHAQVWMLVHACNLCVRSNYDKHIKLHVPTLLLGLLH